MKRRTILITGGSTGIGAATACLAASRGYDVGIGYRNDRASAEAVAAKVTAAGGRALLLQGDIGDPVDISRIFTTFDTLGPLDALINNAGIVTPVARLEAMSPERLQTIFRVNVIGAMLCAKEAIQRMSTTQGGKGGSIVNLSSAAAKLGSPDTYIDYAATKGAIETFTTGLALEQAAHGVRVNAVRPGIIETGIHAKAGDPDRAARVASSLPMRRTGTPQEVAEAILWLCSDAASYVTGTFLDVSGGR